MGSPDHGLYRFIVLLCLFGLSMQFGERNLHVGRLTPRSSREFHTKYVVPWLDPSTKLKVARLQIESFLDAWKKLGQKQSDEGEAGTTYTVFAPLDAVLAARLPLDIADFLMNDNYFQQMLVLNHVTKGKIYPDESDDNVKTQSLSGHNLSIQRNIKDGSFRVNGVQVTSGPIDTTQYLIYVVDELIDISSDDIVQAVERGVQTHTTIRTTPKVKRSSRSEAPRKGLKPPRGPPRPAHSEKQVHRIPQPPAIPVDLRSPAPPPDGPKPPAWSPVFSTETKGAKKNGSVIMLGGITKKRQVDEKNYNAIADSTKLDSQDADELLNVGVLARQTPNQRLMLVELMSPLMKTSAKEISKMMQEDMEKAIHGNADMQVVEEVSPSKPLGPPKVEKVSAAPEVRKKISRTGRERNLATATIFSSLPIYQFLTGAVAARVNLREGNLTLLAPSDVALHRLELSLPALIIRNRQMAVRLIRNHVIEGLVTMSDAVEIGVVRSLDGNELSFEGDSGTYSINGVPVLTPDVILSNGIIHVIDGVLIPDESMDLKPEKDGRNKNTDKIAAEIESVLQDFFPETEVTTLRPSVLSSTMPTIQMDLDDENIEPLPHALRPVSFPNLFAMVEEEEGLIEEFVPGMSQRIPPIGIEEGFVREFMSPDEEERLEIVTSTTPKSRVTKKKKVPTTRAPTQSEEDYDGIDDGLTEIVKEPGIIREKIVESPVLTLEADNDLTETLNEIDEFAEVFQQSQAEGDTIATVLQKNGCNRMLSLLEKADLIAKFVTAGPYTVFAPNDKAFDNMSSERLRELTLRPMLLRRLLLFHIVENQDAEEVGNDVQFLTMEGSLIRFNIYDGEVLINGAKVITTDQVFSNGVVHVLDQIIFPPLGNIAVTMKDRDFGTKRFLEAFQMEKVNILEGNAPTTVIAAVDTAFEELNVTWAELTSDMRPTLTNIINSHIIPGVLYSEACKTETKFFSANGELVTCLLRDGKLYFNGIEAIDKDISATNGVIHLVPVLIRLPTLPERAIKESPTTTTEAFVPSSTAARFEDDFFTPSKEMEVKSKAKSGNKSKEKIIEEETPVQPLNIPEFTIEPEAETLPSVPIMRPGKTKSKKMPATVATAVERHNLTIFSKFLEASSLRELVDQDGPWTIFAPTNNAFAMLPAAIVQQLSHDRFYLKRILSYHIVPGRLTRRHLANDAVFPTLSDGTEVRTNQYSDGKVMWYTVSGSRILDLDEMAGNGVVHVVENVLYPPHGDILTTLNGSPILMQISMLVHDLGISTDLQGDPITLFVPNDESFQHLNMKTMRNQRKLRTWLRKHIVRGTHYSSGLVEGKSLEAIDGVSRINITESTHCINANGQEILYPDISVTNGVLHVTSGLMFTM